MLRAFVVLFTISMSASVYAEDHLYGGGYLGRQSAGGASRLGSLIGADACAKVRPGPIATPSATAAPAAPEQPAARTAPEAPKSGGAIAGGAGQVRSNAGDASLVASGKAVFDAKCLSCHQGRQNDTKIAGHDIAGALATSMPKGKPGSLTADEKAAVQAYLASK